LAAYEQVLALESGKPAEVAIAPPAVAALAASHTPARAVARESRGSRSDFVTAVVEQSGSAGVTPSEISAAFAARKVAISKNFVYNVLSSLFKQKRVRKSAGRYYVVGGKAAPAKSSAKAPAKAAAPPPAKKKRRISEEGMRRIIAATKKRWALQRANAKAK
jgi:hypothetical protein